MGLGCWLSRPSGPVVPSGLGVPTGDEQVNGLEREVMMVAWRGLDP